MQYREHHGEQISALGLGGYSLGGAYGKKDPAGFAAVIQRAHDLGVTLFDVADIYGPAEEVLGKAVAPFRQEVWIATKVGWSSSGKPDCSPEHVAASCEQSLKRLGCDCIDLYQIHFDDPSTPVEQTVGLLEQLKVAGKIRHYGIGHIQPDRMEAYFASGNVFSALMELSAVARGARREKLPLCRARGVAAIAFSPTGRGLLTGAIQTGHRFEEGDIRRIDPLFQRERFASGLRVAARFRDLAEKYGKTPAQAAIAWVLAQPGVTCALIGPTTIPHLEEDLGASSWKLAPADLKELEDFFRGEDEHLQRDRMKNIRAILTQMLAPERALADLVYVLETLVEGGWMAEPEALPHFQQLLGVRDRKDEAALETMGAIQKALKDFVQTLDVERSAE